MRNNIFNNMCSILSTACVAALVVDAVNTTNTAEADSAMYNTVKQKPARGEQVVGGTVSMERHA